ncbi:unnamed protein product [Caenorhabditis brenneri]
MKTLFCRVLFFLSAYSVIPTLVNGELDKPHTVHSMLEEKEDIKECEDRICKLCNNGDLLKGLSDPSPNSFHYNSQAFEQSVEPPIRFIFQKLIFSYFIPFYIRQ